MKFPRPSTAQAHEWAAATAIFRKRSAEEGRRSPADCTTALSTIRLRAREAKRLQFPVFSSQRGLLQDEEGRRHYGSLERKELGLLFFHKYLLSLSPLYSPL